MRAKGIKTGAALALLGAATVMLASPLLGFPPLSGMPPEVKARLAFAFAVAVAFILLFAQPLLRAIYKFFSAEETDAVRFSLRRTDVNVGASLMFVATLISVFAPALLMPPRRADFPTLFLIAASFVSILLCSNGLARMVHRLFSQAKDARAKGDAASSPVGSGLGRVGDAFRAAALPPAQSIPVSGAGAQRVNTGEMVRPTSITDRTTNLLDKR
ncbi:MAG TPA: hypothetical protein VNA19_16610 [Pyrinomonadaceae bacterium]|nr:hypothetical protein [Pyrinomonadaceae bacterium]